MMLLFKNLLFTLVMPGTVAVYVPLLIARNRTAASGARFFAALGMFALGGVLYFGCVWNFATQGRGTPLPLDAPKTLVVGGPYRFTRNSMCLGVLTVISGWAVLFGSWALVAYAAGVGACFHLFIVLYEENHLRRKFGSQYEDYCSRVGRWLPMPGRRPEGR